MSKELKNITKAINAYRKKHNHEVIINASFVAFDKDCNVIDNSVFAFGSKKELILDNKEVLKMIKKEKDDFICW